MKGAGRLKLALVTAALISISCPAISQDGQEDEPTYSPFEYADTLMLEQQPEVACAFLELIYGIDTDNVGALTRLANCKLALGEPAVSQSLIDRAISLEPDNDELKEQARLIAVAASLASLRETVAEIAALEAEIAELSQPLPEPARQVATRPAPQPVVVAPVEVEPLDIPLPGPMASGSMSLTRLYDSNVNGGTYNDSFVGFGLPLIVSPTSKEIGGWATRLSADGSVIIPLDWENGLQLNAGIGATLFDEHPNRHQIGLSGSASWIIGTTVTGGRIRGHANLDWLGGVFDQFNLGVEANAHHQINQTTTLVGGVDLTHRNTAAASDRGWAARGYTGVQHIFVEGLSGGFNIAVERVSVESPIRSHWKFGPEFYVSAALTDRMGLNLSGGVDFVNFDSRLALFPDDRRDIRYRIGARLDVAVPEIAENMSLQLSYDFSHQQSNHDLFDNNRHVVAVGMRYAF